MPERQLTIGQAARFIRRSESTLRRYDGRRILPARRDPVNNYRYYLESELVEYLRQRGLLRHRSFQQPSHPKLEFRFIDLFAGIGGMRLAFESVGGVCIFSSESDRFACQTYEANFGEKPAGDITQIPSAEIPEHDVLLAGFPCQPFSLAGVSKLRSLDRRDGFDDPTRGTLFFHIKRILRDHRPKAFLLENVKHLQRHDGGRTFKVILKSLQEELGYRVYYEVLDGANLVPQHRERIFIVGFDRDVAFGFPLLPSVGPALRTILTSHEEVDPKYTLSDHLWLYLQEYARKHRERGNGFGFSVADPDGVARTLSARYHKDGSEILIDQGKSKNPRRLTPKECKRLMGFPEDFKVPVSDTQAYRQFGNAVVVEVVKRIAVSMVETLREHYPPLTQPSLFDVEGLNRNRHGESIPTPGPGNGRPAD